MNFFQTSKPSGPIWLFCDGGAGEVITLSERPPSPTNNQPKRAAQVTLQAGCGAVARNAEGEILQWA